MKQRLVHQSPRAKRDTDKEVLVNKFPRLLLHKLAIGRPKLSFSTTRFAQSIMCTIFSLRFALGNRCIKSLILRASTKQTQIPAFVYVKQGTLGEHQVNDCSQNMGQSQKFV